DVTAVRPHANQEALIRALVDGEILDAPPLTSGQYRVVGREVPRENAPLLKDYPKRDGKVRMGPYRAARGDAATPGTWLVDDPSVPSGRRIFDETPGSLDWIRYERFKRGELYRDMTDLEATLRAGRRVDPRVEGIASTTPINDGNPVFVHGGKTYAVA